MRFILYFDGGCKDNGSKVKIPIMTIGAIIYKVVGNKRHVVSKIGGVIGKGTNNIAEYSALIAGLKYLSDNNTKGKITIYGDSNTVIKHIKGLTKNSNPKFNIYFKKIHSYLQKLDVESINHIPREQNGEADKIGNDAYKEYMSKL
jgi:ribonuclease HI